MYSGNSSCNAWLPYVGLALLILAIILSFTSFFADLAEVDRRGQYHELFPRASKNLPILMFGNLVLTCGLVAIGVTYIPSKNADPFTPFRSGNFHRSLPGGIFLMSGMFILFMMNLLTWCQSSQFLQVKSGNGGASWYLGTPRYWLWETLGVGAQFISFGLMYWGAATLNPNAQFALFTVFSSIAIIAPVVTFIKNATSNETKNYYLPFCNKI